MADIIVTLLWEKGGVVYRRWLVQTTGEGTKPEDVPLPKSIRLNHVERLVLGWRVADPEKSERRKASNDIVVRCELREESDTEAWRPKTEAVLVNQYYYVYAPPEVAEQIVEEHLERCLGFNIRMRSASPCSTPTRWMFEVWANGPAGARDFSFACALLHEIAAQSGVRIEADVSATDYA